MKHKAEPAQLTGELVQDKSRMCFATEGELTSVLSRSETILFSGSHAPCSVEPIIATTAYTALLAAKQPCSLLLRSSTSIRASSSTLTSITFSEPIPITAGGTMNIRCH